MKNKILAIMVAMAMIIGMPMMAMAEEDGEGNYGVVEAPTGEPVPTNEMDIMDLEQTDDEKYIATAGDTKVNNNPIIIAICAVIVIGATAAGAYIYTKNKKKE